MINLKKMFSIKNIAIATSLFVVMFAGLAFVDKTREGNVVSAQSACDIEDAFFMPNGIIPNDILNGVRALDLYVIPVLPPIPIFTTDAKFALGNTRVKIFVETNGNCLPNQQINIQIHEDNGPMLHNSGITGFDAQKKYAVIELTFNSEGCTGGTCDLYLRAFLNGQDIFNTRAESASNGDNGRVQYTFTQPTTSWAGATKAVFLGTSYDDLAQQLRSLRRSQIGVCMVEFTAFYMTDQIQNGFFNEAGKPTATVEGFTDGCSTADGTFLLVPVDGGFTTETLTILDEIDQPNNIAARVINQNGGYMKFKASWELGEIDCNDGLNAPAPGDEPECNIRIEAKFTRGGLPYYTDFINYKVNGARDVPFRFLSIETFDRDGNQVGGAGFTNSLAPLKASPCYTDDLNRDGVADDPGLQEGCLGLLAPLPDYDRFETGNAPFTNWINNFLRVIIGIASLLAVVMLVILGAQYAATSAFTKKAGYKERIAEVFMGLGLLLGIFLILSIINPNLLLLDPNVPLATLTFDPANIDPEVNGTLPSGGGGLPPGAVCPKPSSPNPQTLNSFVNSVNNKIYYRLGGKGGPPPYPADTKKCNGLACSGFCPMNSGCYDCSGFVAVARQCAGYSNKGAGTSTIFSSANNPIKIENYQISTQTINGNFKLQPGDLIGFSAAQSGTQYGHVGIYLGNDKIAHAQGVSRTTPGPTVQSLDLFIQSISNPSKNKSRAAWLVR